MRTHKKGHSELGGVEILLVDDSSISRKFIKSVLEHAGVHVTSAINGAEAVSTILSGDHFDLVLMDIEMPQMNGYQATRMIRSHENFNELPIIGLTGLSEEGEIKHCLEVGMNDCVGKPFKMERIYNVIEHHLETPHQTIVATSNSKPSKPKATPPRLPGIDTEDGLERAVGDLKLYNEVLQDFCDRYRTAEKTILDALASGRSDDAGIKIHTIKGIAGTLGAKKLYRFAVELEMALNGDNLPVTEEALDRFLDELAWVVDGIDTYLEQPLLTPQVTQKVGGQSPELGPQAMVPKLKRLGRLVSEFDVSACGYFDSLRGELDSLLNTTLVDKLATHIRRLDFDEAAYLIEELTAQLGKHGDPR